MPPTPVGASNSSAELAAQRAAEIAAERARAAAEAAARAAAEAAAKAAAAEAAAAAKRQEAAAAQQKARGDGQTADQAQNANNQAQQAKTAAQQELDRAQSALDSKSQQVDQRGPRPGDVERLGELRQQVNQAQTRFDRASADAAQAQQTAQQARATADASRREAVNKGNAAIEAQKEANTAAQAAGKPQPFREANEVRDIFDAGSLDAQAQRRLLGETAVVTPQEAARADAQRVSEAAARSPSEGAEELQRQLRQNPDPAYRESLQSQTAETQEQIISSLGDANVSATDANSIVRNLARSADLAGPEARTELARQLNDAGSFSLTNPSSIIARQRVLDGLQANASDPKSVELGAEMARQLREANRYESADAITNLSPEFEEAAAQSAGDEALRAEVDLNTVAEERTNVEDVTRQTDTDARTQADEVFELAGKKPSELPPGVSVERGATEDQATLVVRNEQGRVIERTTAQRDGDRITLDSTQYDPEGNAQRSVVNSEGAEGPTTVTQARWRETNPASPGTPPSIDDLKNSRDPNVALSETTVRRDGDALVQSSYTQDAQNGVTQTEKRYSTQDDKDGITDRLDERFEDGPVDRVDIRTTNIPPPGAEGPDGEPAKASVTEGTSFSQGDVRLTGTTSRVVDSPADGQSPSAADLEATADRAEDADESPKSWQLEVSETNELNTQTFVEGQTDLSVVTRRRIEGNTVTETTEGKVPNPDGEGDPVSISGNSSRTYNANGQITSSHSDQTDATGTRRVADYERTEARNAQGELEVTERTTSSEEPKDGPRRTLEQEQVAVQTDQGPQLVSASQTMTGPEGTARASITPEGQELTVNGQRMESVEQLQGLPEAEASLGATTMDGLSQQVRDFNELATGIHTAHLEQAAANNQGEQKAAVSANNYGLARLKQSLTTANSAATGTPDPTGGPATSRTPVPEWKNAPSISLSPTERLAGGTTGGIQLLAGAAGLYTSGRSLINNLSQGNYLNAAKDALGLTTSGISVYGGANALITAVRGSGSGLSLGGAVGTAGGRINPSVAGQVAGRFAAGLGVVAGGIEIYQGIQNGNGWQIASGAVTAGAAVGGYLAVGAAAGAWGGPAGAAVGLAIGLAAFGVTKLFDWFDDSEHDIASQQI
jgi:hypothetical protein